MTRWSAARNFANAAALSSDRATSRTATRAANTAALISATSSDGRKLSRSIAWLCR